MPTRFLSDAEVAQLAGFPAEVAAEDLVTYFDLAPDDAACAWVWGWAWSSSPTSRRQRSGASLAVEFRTPQRPQQA